MKKFVVVSLVIILSSCISSVSNKIVKSEGLSNKTKAVAILNEAWKAHGLDKLSTKKVYEVKGVNHWKGIAGKFGKVWPKQKQSLKLQFAVGTFDSRVTFLDGKKEGEIRGLQSWNYYVQQKGSTAPEFKKKPHTKTEFGLAAFHYFFEVVDRLKKVDLITYGGEKDFKGNKYDLVFVTWEKLKTHAKHDQYMLWVNKKTKMVDYIHFTIHDTAFPGNTVSGSNEFTNYKNVDGIKIPFEQIIYVGAPKKNQSKYLHKLTVSEFKFDSFEKEVLYPNKALNSMGDSK